MKIECSVCFDKLGNDEKLVSVTKCGHLFHKDCVETWIDRSTTATCPQCRYVLLKMDLRTVYFNNMGNRNSDIFNSSMVVNLRNIQEDLFITQSNLELQIEHMKTEIETLNEFKRAAIAEKARLQAEVTALRLRTEIWEAEATRLKMQIALMQVPVMPHAINSFRIKTEPEPEPEPPALRAIE